MIRATRQFICVTIDPGAGAWAKAAAERWKIGVERKGGTFDYPVALVLDPGLAVVDWRQGFVEPPEFAKFLYASAAASAEAYGRAGPKAASKVEWEESYEKALESATLSGKPILLAFLDPASADSERMAAETFADPAVIGLSAGFACVRVNPAEGDDSYVARSYKADVEKAGVGFEFPLLVIITKDMDFVAARSGFSTAADLAAMLRKAAGK